MSRGTVGYLAVGVLCLPLIIGFAWAWWDMLKDALALWARTLS